MLGVVGTNEAGREPVWVRFPTLVPVWHVRGGARAGTGVSGVPDTRTGMTRQGRSQGGNQCDWGSQHSYRYDTPGAESGREPVWLGFPALVPVWHARGGVRAGTGVSEVPSTRTGMTRQGRVPAIAFPIWS